MKKAHAEGRAWNIGKSRWNNKPSYPEQFFIKVIQNEFDDKNYIREYPFGIYSIDFAWPQKKLAIEIDGEQHERFKEYKERDVKKDKYLSENGWKVIRINWNKFFNNTKYYISYCNEFINNCNIAIDEQLIEVDYNLLEKLIKYNNNIPTQYLDKSQKQKLTKDRISKVLNSNIEFSKYGWVKEVAVLLDMLPQKVNQWMKRYMLEFYNENCYKLKK